MFEQLSTDIYHIIHSYLSHYDYRQLMNSNTSVLKPIKRETVMYNLRGFRELLGSDYEESIEFLVDYQNIIFSKIMNPQPQIMFSHIEEFPKSLLKAFHSIFEGICSISFSFDLRNASYELSSFPLHLFSNICHISLTHVGSLTSLSVLNGNILSLKIDDAEWLVDISQINNLPTLEKVMFIDCDRLIDIFL
jgi:hypothetical protein